MYKFYFYISLIFYNVINSQNILILSIPKCGTHLIAKAVELLTNQNLEKEILPNKILNNGTKVISDNTKIFRCHLPYNRNIEKELVKNNFKVFFIYRDPRDQIVSSAFWIAKLLKANKFEKFTYEQLIDLLIKRKPKKEVLKYNTYNKEKITFQNFNFNEMITNLILKTKDYYSAFFRWTNSKNVYTTKFENLVGHFGNGDDNLQKMEIQNIMNFLSKKNRNLIDYCVKNLYGGTFTFREGKIGNWKRYFTNEQKSLFKKNIGNLLIKLGYERDLNW